MEHSDLKILVDADRGMISREIFTSPAIYKRELESLFTRTWLFVGHESLIPNPGDFYLSRMGEESVILCRDRTGEVHVFLNSCTHRGMKVCRYDKGNAKVFTCPYHAWSFALDGSLQGVPHFDDLYDGVLDRDDWSLLEVDRMVVYKGTIWASWDKDAPNFETYLGDAKLHLDMTLDCRDGRSGGSEVIGVHRWKFPANWKFAAENFLGDSYHNHSHGSVDAIGIGPSARSGVKGRRDDEMKAAQHIWISFPEGHGVHSAMEHPDAEFIDSYLDQPEIGAYFRHCYEERRRRLGNEAQLIPFTGTIFPNTSYHGRQPRGLCAWHPHSSGETEGWRFFLVDKDAPTAVKDFLRHYYMRYSGPAGMTEQDDMENWLYASAASKGTIAKRLKLNYQQSMGAAKLNDPLPGLVATQMSEHMARGYYTRWRDYLEGRDWDHLLGVGDPRFSDGEPVTKAGRA